MADTIPGHVRLALVTGPAGSGKTRLAADLSTSLAPRWTTVWADDDAPVGSPAHQLHTLITGSPESGAVPPPSRAGRLRAAVGRPRADEPVLLVVDDLHLLGPEATDNLSMMMDERAEGPLFVVAAYRLGAHPISSPTARAVAGLARRRGIVEVRLAPAVPVGPPPRPDGDLSNRETVGPTPRSLPGSWVGDGCTDLSFQRLAQELHHSGGHGQAVDEGVADLVSTCYRHLRRGEIAAAATAANAAVRAVGGVDDVAESAAWVAVGRCGDPHRALEALERIAQHAAAHDDIGACCLALARLTSMCLATGQVDEASSVARRNLRTARTTRDPAFWGPVQAGLAAVLATRGELDIARTLAEELATLALPPLGVLGRAVMWAVSIDSGDLDAARRHREVVLAAVAAVPGHHLSVTARVLEARLLLAEGNLGPAVAAIAAADEQLWSPVHEHAGEVLAAAVDIAIATGDVEALDRHRARAAALARDLPGVGPAGFADLATAAHDLLSGDVHAAADGSSRAAVSLEAAGWRPMAVGARVLEARALMAAGSTTPSAVEEALAAATRLVQRYGLSAWAAAIAGLRAEVGLGEGGADALAVLDSRERRAVERAAAGASNREIAAELFLAEKTVRNLLSGAFAKLGVQRRSQLSALVDPR